MPGNDFLWERILWEQPSSDSHKSLPLFQELLLLKKNWCCLVEKLAEHTFNSEEIPLIQSLDDTIHVFLHGKWFYKKLSTRCPEKLEIFETAKGTIFILLFPVLFLGFRFPFLFFFFFFFVLLMLDYLWKNVQQNSVSNQSYWLYFLVPFFFFAFVKTREPWSMAKKPRMSNKVGKFPYLKRLNCQWKTKLDINKNFFLEKLHLHFPFKTVNEPKTI